MLMERWQLNLLSLKMIMCNLTMQLLVNMEVWPRIIIKKSTMMVKKHTQKLTMAKQIMGLIKKIIPQRTRMPTLTMKRLPPTILHLIIIKNTMRPILVHIPLALIRKRTTMLRPPTHMKQVKLLKML